MVLLHSHLCTRRSRNLGLQPRRETDAERIPHGADNLDLGGIKGVRPLVKRGVSLEARFGRLN